MSWKGQGQAGTTLIEMMIAVGIVATMCLGAITFLQYMNEHAATSGAYAASQTELARFAARLKRYYYVGTDTDTSFKQRIPSSIVSPTRRYWRFKTGSFTLDVGNACAPIPDRLKKLVPSFNKVKMNEAMDKIDGISACDSPAFGAFAGTFDCGEGSTTTVFMTVTDKPKEFFPTNLRPAGDGGSKWVAAKDMPVMSMLCRQNVNPANWDNFVIFFGYLDGSRKTQADKWSRIRWVSSTIRLTPTMSFSNSAAMLP